MDVSFTKIEAEADPDHGYPCSRSSHGFSCCPGAYNDGAPKLVLMGGENVARTPLPLEEMVWIAEPLGETDFEKTTWKWRRITPKGRTEGVLPPPRLAHSQAYCRANETIYIFGGRAGIQMQEQAMNDLWAFHVPTEEWYPVEPTGCDLPEARSFHKMLAIGARLYVFGGCGTSSGRLADLHEFDTVTNKWTALGASTLLKGRGGPSLLHFCKGVDPCVAVISGFTGEESKDGHVYNIAKEAWEDSVLGSLSDLRPRSVCVFGSFPNNEGVIIGGEVDPSDRGHEGAGGFANDVILLNGGDITKQIVRGDKAPWPECRGWADGDTFVDKEQNQYLLFFGGLSGDDTTPKRLDDMWMMRFVK